MELFDFAHYGDVKRTKHSLTRTIDFETGAFQTQRVAVNPIISFEATYQGDKEFMKQIEEFWDRHEKHNMFQYQYDGEIYNCKFTSDYNPTDTWGYIDSNGRTIAKSSVTLTMRVCNI